MRFFSVILFLIVILVFGASFYVPLHIYSEVTKDLEPPENKLPTGLVIEYSDGTPLYSPKTVWKDYDDIPQLLKDVIIASEDRRFYRHNGVDLRGIIRSLYVILTTDEVQGGSTITQQLARTLFLTTERTWERKIKEIMIALWLEQRYSKEEILELYVNSVYLGNGISGFPAAARYYFRKNLEDLTPLEIAMLVATLRAPERVHPMTERNKAYTKTVLRKMFEAGILTQREYETYLETLPTFVIRPAESEREQLDNELVWMIINELNDLGFSLNLLRKGFRVRTTIDRKLQRLLSEHIPDKKMAGLIVEHSTGRIRAAYGLGIFNGRRQLGSTVKPLYYYLAFLRGWHKDDVIDDKPITVGRWSPKNFDKEYWGSVTLEKAIIYSRNVPSVNLFLALGPKTVQRFLRDVLNLRGYYPNDATISLGTIETSLVDLATAYTPIFNGGAVVRPRIVESVTDKNGVSYYTYVPNVVAVVTKFDRSFVRSAPEASIMMLQVMEKVVTMGTARRAAIPGRYVYGKTGTAEKNAWFVGGDGKYLFLMVRDGEATGGRNVAPVWKEVALRCDIGYTPVSMPLDTQVAKISAQRNTDVAHSPETIDDTRVQHGNPLAPNDESTTVTITIESDLENRIRDGSVTVDELFNFLKDRSPEEQRDILSRVNEINSALASEVYMKLLGGGEF